MMLMLQEGVALELICIRKHIGTMVNITMKNKGQIKNKLKILNYFIDIDIKEV